MRKAYRVCIGSSRLDYTKPYPHTNQVAHHLTVMGFWWYDTSNKQEVPNYG